jgi:hypothetical protein
MTSWMWTQARLDWAYSCPFSVDIISTPHTGAHVPWQGHKAEHQLSSTSSNPIIPSHLLQVLNTEITQALIQWKWEKVVLYTSLWILSDQTQLGCKFSKTQHDPNFICNFHFVRTYLYTFLHIYKNLSERHTQKEMFFVCTA